MLEQVASCYSCKIFFRRIVLRQRRYLCSRDGDCFAKEDWSECLSGSFAFAVERTMCPRSVRALFHSTGKGRGRAAQKMKSADVRRPFQQPYHIEF